MLPWRARRCRGTKTAHASTSPSPGRLRPEAAAANPPATPEAVAPLSHDQSMERSDAAVAPVITPSAPSSRSRHVQSSSSAVVQREDMRWYVMRGGRVSGPVHEAALSELVRKNVPDAQIQPETGGDWRPLATHVFSPETPPSSARVSAVSHHVIPKAPVLGIGGKVASALTVLGFLAFIGWMIVDAATGDLGSGTKATSSAAIEAAPPPEPPQQREPTLLEQVSGASTIGAALSILKPHFADTQDSIDPAAAVLAIWAANNMSWADLQQQPETSRALVMKDSDATRGNRLCARGSIIQITVDKSAGVTLFEGGLMAPGFNVVRFIAVGSTGDIVERSNARFCGIVTGRKSYSNARGGTTHAVQVVGMFDLPENRPAVPARGR